jgi:hypothetical protein
MSMLILKQLFFPMPTGLPFVALLLVGVLVPAAVGVCRQPVPSFTEQHERLPQAEITTVTVSQGLGLYVAPHLATVEQIQHDTQARVVLNAGFFDPLTTVSASYTIRHNTVLTDPQNNPALVNNPALQPYLRQIFNRSELQALQCDPNPSVSYRIARHLDAVPPACQLQWSVGAGPQLLPTLTDTDEGFTAYNPQGKRTRDPIGVMQQNARSAVAVLPDGKVMLVLVSQRPNAKGMSLPELATWLKGKGATQALALDGGSSSSMVVDTQTRWAKGSLRNGQWVPVKRAVKTALIVY